MKGNLEKIPDFAKRIKEIVDAELGDEEPRGYTLARISTIQNLLVTPDNLKDSILPDFEPAFGICDVMENKIPTLLSMIQNHKGSDQELADKLQRWAKSSVIAVFEEVKDGFHEGATGLIALLKVYINDLITAACEPGKAGLVTMLGVPPIMNYISDTWFAHEEASGSQDVEMAEEKVEESKDVEMKSETLMDKYARIVAQDKARIAAAQPKPTSRAYNSLNLTGQSETVDSEADMTRQAYQTDRALLAKTKPEYLKGRIREAVIQTGRLPTNQVNESMKQINPESDIPDSLKQAFYAMMKAGVQSRIGQDADYQNLKGSGRFSALDKL